MKRFFLVLCFTVAGCGGGDGIKGIKSKSIALPIEDGIFTSTAHSTFFSYREIQSQNNGQVTYTDYSFDSSSMSYVGRDISITEGGRINARMTDAGWLTNMSEERDSFYLNDSGQLIDNRGYFPLHRSATRSERLAGKDIALNVEGASWADGLAFGSEAMRFYTRLANPDYIYVVDPISCGPGCYGILSLGGGTLEDWAQQYAVRDGATGKDGYYWFGLSLLFDGDGSVATYNYFREPETPISTRGSWEIQTINGEQLLLISLPAADKYSMSITVEANPMVTILDVTRVPGTWYMPSQEVPSAFVQYVEFLNRAAIKDLTNAYISSL